MEILRKKEFEEDRLFQNFHEMILYHMRQMQQCLTTAGKMFCDHNDATPTLSSLEHFSTYTHSDLQLVLPNLHPDQG